MGKERRKTEKRGKNGEQWEKRRKRGKKNGKEGKNGEQWEKKAEKGEEKQKKGKEGGKRSGRERGKKTVQWGIGGKRKSKGTRRLLSAYIRKSQRRQKLSVQVDDSAGEGVNRPYRNYDHQAGEGSFADGEGLLVRRRLFSGPDENRNADGHEDNRH